MFTGVYTALITPFHRNQIDEEALQQLINYQCMHDIDGIVVCGSTGEFFTLSESEQDLIVKIAVDEAKGRMPILVGVGHFTTEHTIRLALQAQNNGAAGLLVVTPPYIKPSGSALLAHYIALHDHTTLPIILYDNPGRGSIVIPDAIVIALSKLPRIVGLKDASGNLTRPSILATQLPTDFSLLSGDDITTLAFMAQGGHGVISTSANVAPHLIKQQITAWQQGNLQQAAVLRNQLLPLHQAMYCEPSPAAIKYACSKLGLCRDKVRLPLQSLSLQNRPLIDNILNTLQLMP